MAVLNVLIDRDPQQVWDVLSDGSAYADWVVGTRHIEDVDPHWPELGSQIRYALGFGRWTIEDVTTVRLVEPGRRLELEAYAGRLGSARISIALLPWGEERTLVIVDEHPLTGPGALWHTLLVDVLLRFRNQRMVRSLARLVHERHPA
ncbi:SRPBCC family protein [Pseudonocardia asaccharolytica]|uniref:SRPBCC family protein n=1 Tax=Pseudonocardia asaccharolytica TaxID=54010 RepID=UPI0004125871|nr:SRPBCC family protein [Pseudonocardia asaccharolytica]